MRHIMGVDTGGTFTDFSLIDEHGGPGASDWVHTRLRKGDEYLIDPQ